MRAARSVRRIRRGLVAGALVGLSSLPTAVLAQDGSPGDGAPDAECCPLLEVPVGARATGLAGASTATMGPDAAFRNPGGLAGLTGNSFLVHHSEMGVDMQVEAFSLLVTPFSSTFGLSYQLFDYGDIPVTDESGVITGERSYRDHLLIGSFATGVAGGLSAGVNYKLYHQREDCTGSSCGGSTWSGTTHAVDVGLHYRPRWSRSLELGLSVVNVGSDLQVVNAEQADRLPARLHIGAAFDVLSPLRTDSTIVLRALVDGRTDLHGFDELTPSVGMELDVQQVIFLRAGYTPGEGLGTGGAVGLGIRYDWFDLSVARSFINSLADTEPFQVSFGLNF